MTQNVETETPQERRLTTAERLKAVLKRAFTDTAPEASTRAAARAWEFTARAEEYTETQVAERGKALLVAGQQYMQAGDLERGTEALQAAFEPLQLHLHGGTLDAFLSSTELNRSLGEAYKNGGQPDSAERFFREATDLTLDTIKYFGPLETLPTFYDLNPELPEA